MCMITTVSPPLPILRRPRERGTYVASRDTCVEAKPYQNKQEYVGKDVLRNVFEAIPYYSRECVGRDEIT